MEAVVISTKTELIFFQLASFVYKPNDRYFLSCHTAHKDNKCQWLFIGLHRGVIVPWQAIHRLPFLMSLQDVNYPKSNSHLFNITINSHDQELFLSIHILFIENSSFGFSQAKGSCHSRHSWHSSRDWSRNIPHARNDTISNSFQRKQQDVRFLQRCSFSPFRSSKAGNFNRKAAYAAEFNQILQFFRLTGFSEISKRSGHSEFYKCFCSELPWHRNRSRNTFKGE